MIDMGIVFGDMIKRRKAAEPSAMTTDPAAAPNEARPPAGGYGGPDANSFVGRRAMLRNPGMDLNQLKAEAQQRKDAGTMTFADAELLGLNDGKWSERDGQWGTTMAEVMTGTDRAGNPIMSQQKRLATRDEWLAQNFNVPQLQANDRAMQASMMEAAMKAKAEQDAQARTDKFMAALLGNDNYQANGPIFAPDGSLNPMLNFTPRPAAPPKRDVRNVGNSLVDVTDPSNPQSIYAAPEEEPIQPVGPDKSTVFDPITGQVGEWDYKIGGYTWRIPKQGSKMDFQGLHQQSGGEDVSKLPLYWRNEQDKEAYDWAKSNPDDPRAAAILKKLGVQ